eukprot:104256_1
MAAVEYNGYVTWLTAVTFGTCLLLWYNKRLILLLILWYITMMIFIYVDNAIVYFILLGIDIISYYFLLHGKDTSSPVSLDVFGEKVISRLLSDIIRDRLTAKRDEQMIEKVKNRQMLVKEAKRRKKESKALGRKGCCSFFTDKWRKKETKLKQS